MFQSLLRTEFMIAYVQCSLFNLRALQPIPRFIKIAVRTSKTLLGTAHRGNIISFLIL